MKINHEFNLKAASKVRLCKIIDRPCGHGKTSDLIKSFKNTDQNLMVVPLLSECDRVIEATSARGITFQQPEQEAEVRFDENDNEEITKSKINGLRRLLLTGQNVVTTHAMFDTLAHVAQDKLLDDYHIHIDEVLSVIDPNFKVNAKAWDRVFIKSGLCSVDPKTRQVITSEEWSKEFQDLSEYISPKLYKAAAAGRLYNIEGGYNVAVMPEALLKAGLSLTVYTYKAEGSIMYAYLKRIGLNPVHDKGDPLVERKFVREARQLITVKTINSLNHLEFSYSKQTDSKKKNSRVYDNLVPRSLSAIALTYLKDVPFDKILITCPKEKWFENGKEPKLDIEGNYVTHYKPGPYAIRSRLQGRKGRITWLANTTRGTNDYRNCSHLIYLYNQYLNPNIKKFIGKGVVTDDDYALTELIQWVWRSRIRRGEPITVWLPSNRMRNLFLNWLYENKIPQSVLEATR